jgi:PilZ domain
MMNSLIPPRNDATFDDRRRYVRHKLNLSPVVVVDLGPNNGGNLIDIGEGGLSVQAVAKLNPRAALTIHFRLQGMAQPIEVAGRVMWVGPTQTVAGISFNNLPGSTEQQIIEWIARQERPTQDAPSDDPSTEPDDSPLPLFPISLYQPDPRKRIVLPLHEPLVSSTADSKPLTEPFKLSAHVGPLAAKRLVLPKSVWNSHSVEISSAGDWVFVAPETSASESRWRRRRFAIAIAASVLGIVALILIVLNLNNPEHGGTTSSQSVGWVDRVNAFFGKDVPKKMDPAKAGVQVWTFQRSGYYYCADDPNFKKLRPGAIIKQGDAIQRGYQPRLDFCK